MARKPKRKPRKRKPRRRKQVVPRQPSDIPYSKFRVEWIDILSDSGWADEKAFNKMKLATPVNEGWVYEKTKDHVKIFASYDREDDGSFTFGDRTIIPTACIKKIIKINQMCDISSKEHMSEVKTTLTGEGVF